MEKFLWNDPEIEQLLLNDAEEETLEKFIGADAELPDMLNARERRVWMQEQLLSEFPGVLVSFTLNIPGPVKVLPLVPEAFAFALSEIVSALDTAKIPVLKRSLILDKTGPEAFLCVDADALAVKRLLVPLEDASDLGRLYDIDIPGPVKVLPLVPEAFAFALSEIVSALDTAKIPVLKRSLILDKTGPEAFLCVDADALAVKRLLVPLEDASDLGRLYDIDIIGRDGKKISRSDIGQPGRTCLLCGRPARECSRSRAHSVAELTERINAIFHEHFS